MENLLNIIFPPKCLFCEADGDIFCDNCLSSCEILKTMVCIKCQRPSINGITHKECNSEGLLPSQFVSAFKYQGLVRECIKKSKYSSRQFMALNKLSFEAVHLVYESGVNFNNFTVIPIPMNKQKQKLRGFNQAEKIAKVLAFTYKLSIENSILIRVKNTKSQYENSRKERFVNVKGSFSVSMPINGGKFLLVDDICTSGATFLESAKELYKAGADDVKCFSVCRKILK